MKNTEQIFELLQKKELTNDENVLLQQIISTDPEANSFYKTYIKTGEVVKKISHPDLNELAEYILFKNGNSESSDEIISAIPSIENHIRNCKQCTEELKTLNLEYSEVDQFLTAEMNQVKSQTNTTVLQTETRKSFSLFRYSYLTAAAAIVIYFGLFLFSGSITKTSHELAALENDADLYVTRGRVTTYFQESLKSLEAGDYESAIKNLQADISRNSNDETVFYSHYILGLAYLETAKNDFIGLFPTYDTEKAIAGKNEFLKTIEKNSSGKYPNISLNAYYYAAKACLMNDDVDQAKQYLKIVVNEKGSKMSDAQKILAELE